MKLTIFTPTYNRCNLLPRVYQSLLNQGSLDFEWLIIDDGSTDITKEVVDSFLNNGKFPVRYYRKNNGGKHTAHNTAVDLASGDYFMCLDSDDWLADNAIYNLLNVLDECSPYEGVIAYKVDETNKLLSDVFPVGLSKTTTVELTLDCDCNGEFVLVYPTLLLCNNHFPVFKGESFITESVLYDNLSKQCFMCLLPKVICVCEYQNEGYSKQINKVMKNNPAGYCLYFMNRIDLQRTIGKRLICAGKYYCFRWFAKKQVIKYNGNYRKSVVLGVPLGWLFWIYYKVIRGF